MERFVETQERLQTSFSVALDTETFDILNTDPGALLKQLFEDDPDKVFLLIGSGFKMETQVQRWIEKHREAYEKRLSSSELSSRFIKETIQDVLGFYFEYLTGQDIFPIKVEFAEDQEGNKTVYASEYGQTLESLALVSERDGALANGVRKAVDILINSGPETIVFITSPSGWSGLGHDYPDTQTYVYWINEDGNLDGATIRTDIGLSDNEKLIGISPTREDSVRERIRTIVSSPQYLQANGFEAVLDLIEEASARTFSKQRDELKRYRELFTLNGEAKEIIGRLETDLLNNISHLNMDSIKLFAKLVGKAILDLRRQVLDNNINTTTQPNPYRLGQNNNHYYSSNHDMYRHLAYDVQQLEGCNGGGQKQAVDARQMLGLLSQVDGGPKYVKNCGACGISINAFISSGYQCPSCHRIYLGC